MKRPLIFVVLSLCAAQLSTATFAQDAAATRRLARVPAPVGAQGRVEDLYSASYALLVGVSRYDDPAAWTALDSIPTELTDLKTALVALGFTDVQVAMNPSGADLRRTVEDFIGRHGYEAGARLVFVFSGHGHTLDGGNRGYFVPRDAPDPLKNEPGFRRTALSMDQVATWARDVTSKHALFAFDSCFSGSIFRTREREVPKPISTLTAKKVREFLSAGSAGEPVPARSVFAPTLVRALRGEADLDHDGFVTGTELGNWVQGRVIEYGTRQTPQFGKLRDPEFDEGDLVFAVPGTIPPAPTISSNAAVTTAADADVLFWSGVTQQRGNPSEKALLDEYLERFGAGGQFATLARARLAELKPPAAAAAPEPAPANNGNDLFERFFGTGTGTPGTPRLRAGEFEIAAFGLTIGPLKQPVGPVKSGALVVAVTNDATWKDGIHAGDVITRVEGREVKDSVQAAKELQKIQGGSTVKLVLFRDNNYFVVETRAGNLLKQFFDDATKQ